mgnify:FL=1
MSTEAKVGAFTVAGLVLLAFVLVHISGFHLGQQQTYKVYADFPQVVGLNPSAEVRFVGVKVGSVDTIDPVGLGVRVSLKLKPDVKIPRASQITISSSGVMGEKFVSIQPLSTADVNDCLQDGDVIDGQPEQGMESMMEGLNKAVAQVQQLLQSLNEVLGNPQLKTAMVDISTNVRDVTANLKVMTESMARMAVSNEGDVRTMVRNLTQMSAGLNQAVDSVNHLLNDFAGDGQTMANIKVAIENIAATSQSIERTAKSIEGTVTDPQVSEDLRAVLHNAHAVSQKANDMMDRANNIQVKPGIETMYAGKDGKWRTNFDLNVATSPGSFFRLGLDDIGEENRTNVQLGRRSGSFAGRAGVFDSKAGIGVDAYTGQRWKFSLDAYDPNDFRLDLRSQYEVSPDTYLVGQWRGLNKSESRAAYFGIRHDF